MMGKVSKSIPKDTAFDRETALHIHLFLLTCSVCPPVIPESSCVHNIRLRLLEYHSLTLPVYDWNNRPCSKRSPVFMHHL